MNPSSSNDGIETNQNLAPEITHPPNGGQHFEPHTEPAPHEAGTGNIDKIRDIIFGTHMRDYEQRFARLEETLRKESLDIRDTTRRHLEALEAFVHKELAALESRLNIERDERAENQARLSADLTAHSASVAKKIGEVENQEAHAKREIRNDLLQQSK